MKKNKVIYGWTFQLEVRPTLRDEDVGVGMGQPWQARWSCWACVLPSPGLLELLQLCEAGERQDQG